MHSIWFWPGNCLKENILPSTEVSVFFYSLLSPHFFKKLDNQSSKLGKNVMRKSSILVLMSIFLLFVTLITCYYVGNFSPQTSQFWIFWETSKAIMVVQIYKKDHCSHRSKQFSPPFKFKSIIRLPNKIKKKFWKWESLDGK